MTQEEITAAISKVFEFDPDEIIKKSLNPHYHVIIDLLLDNEKLQEMSYDRGYFYISGFLQGISVRRVLDECSKKREAGKR